MPKSRSFTVPPDMLRQQYASSDPNASAWVAANAGSGKTHVLTQRVIRLLLDGNQPDRILCLTFTKAAAANMKTRVFDTLSSWTMLSDGELRDAIADLTGEQPTLKECDHARSLFASALDTPGGLKIQTIHSFCEALLHQFPLEANVPGQFSTLQDAGQAELLSQAKTDVLSGALSKPSLLADYLALNRSVSQGAIDMALATVSAMRSEFRDWVEPNLEAAMAPMFQMTCLQPDDTEVSLLSRELSKISRFDDALRSILEIAKESDKKSDVEFCERLTRYFDGSTLGERFDALCETVLTSSFTIRSESRIVTANVKNRIPDVVDTLMNLAVEVLAIRDRVNNLRLLHLSRRLYHLCGAVIERYEALKRARGAIDFDDQIHKAAMLLTRSEIREWIRYRLDQGIDHLLIDEAQDTSPRQWQVINAVTGDFHTGQSASLRNRTIFVVGDEKQSIYSFQGADPAEFSRQEEALERSVRGSRGIYHRGHLHLSFRSTPDVLNAVDVVFEHEENRRGLTQSGERPTHDAIRSNDPGEVQVWPMISRVRDEKVEDWTAPIDHEGEDDPAVKLAEKISTSIKEWVGNPLPGSDKPVRFGDILVLVRKRDRFITALTRIMKDAGLAVAGADRIVLTEHIAVEDLLAIGRFVQLPGDDLNLACVLKSVLIDLTEEELFDLAHGRQSSLMAELKSAANNSGHDCHLSSRRALSVLETVREKGRRLDVFEFYTWLLGPGGARRAFLARLGMEAEDVLDAFLDEALRFVRDGGNGLEDFIFGLTATNPDIKREVELDRDEVRILTAHAAKGLESRIVFLVDPGSEPWSQSHRPAILKIEDDAFAGYLWLPSSRFHTQQTQRATNAIQAAAEEEYRRLLYVGMTRAADRLIVCGYSGVRGAKGRTWHTMVEEALKPTAREEQDAQGEVERLVWRSGGTSIEETPGIRDAVPDTDGEKEALSELPEWLYEPAGYERPLPAPLSPAGAYALIDPEYSELTGHTVDGSPSFTTQRGNAIHKLLETLPDIAAEQREELARAYLERSGADWSSELRKSALNDVLSVLNSPEFSCLFTLPSRAEVSVIGSLETKSGQRHVSGQIDRLIVTENEVMIIDYKSGIPPADGMATPDSHVTQLALYREILLQIYPDHVVRSALLWTRTPMLQFLTDAEMDEAIVKIREF